MQKWRRLEANFQYALNLPPEVTPEHRQVWATLKQTYHDIIVILKDGETYFCLGNDALMLNEVTGESLAYQQVPVCYFPIRITDIVLKKLYRVDLYAVICDPPEQSELHIFM